MGGICCCIRYRAQVLSSRVLTFTKRPSPSSPASTAGPNESDAQPRHGVSRATVHGLASMGGPCREVPPPPYLVADWSAARRSGSYTRHKCKCLEHYNISHVSIGYIKVGGSGSAEGSKLFTFILVCVLVAHGGERLDLGLEYLFFSQSVWK